MLDLKKFFQGEERPQYPDTELETHGELAGSLEDGYSDMIAEQLERGGIAIECVTIEIRNVGTSRDGLPVFLGMVRLGTWERRSALRLLLGLPLLEAKVRKIANASWLHDVSHFGGLWLHASGQLHESAAMGELRSLIMDIERNDSLPPADTGPWSLPTDMGKLA